jgi:hypothetical protein
MISYLSHSSLSRSRQAFVLLFVTGELKVWINREMVPDLADAGSMTNRSNNCPFLLPGVNATEQVDRSIVNFDSQALGLAIGSALEGILDFFTQFLRVYASRCDSDLVNYANDARQA